MFATNDVTLEEMIRHFYPARTWAIEHDLDMGYGNHQETPTISWAMATVLCRRGRQTSGQVHPPLRVPLGKAAGRAPDFPVGRPGWKPRAGAPPQRGLRRGALGHTGSARYDHRVARRGDSAYESQGDAYPFDAVVWLGCMEISLPGSSFTPRRRQRPSPSTTRKVLGVPAPSQRITQAVLG